MKPFNLFEAGLRASLLKLRRGVRSRRPTDNEQNFSGDAFAILETWKGRN